MEPVENDKTGAKLEIRSLRRAANVMGEMKRLSRQLTDEDIAFLKGLPTMIRQNGFGQSIAYLHMKANDKKKSDDKTKTNDKAKQRNYGQILAVLCKPLNLRTPDKVMESILDLSVHDYHCIQQEAVEYAAWMKKFAIAFRPQPGDKEGAREPTVSK